MNKNRVQLIAFALAVLVSACGGATNNESGQSEGETDTTTTLAAPLNGEGNETPTGQSGGDEIDLEGVDACSLLDLATVQSLTGSSGDFLTDSFESSHCFWGSAQAGVPGYVEIELVSTTDFVAYGALLREECAVTPVDGVGDVAELLTCEGVQKKMYLLAYERGTVVSLLVNEPPPHLTSMGLGDVVNFVFEGL